MLDEPPSRSSLLVDTIQEAPLNVVPMLAQEARTLSRQAVDRRSRSVVQEAAGGLGDRPLDVPVLKEGQERARNVLRASTVEAGKLRTRCQPEARNILQ